MHKHTRQKTKERGNEQCRMRALFLCLAKGECYPRDRRSVSRTKLLPANEEKSRRMEHEQRRGKIGMNAHTLQSANHASQSARQTGRAVTTARHALRLHFPIWSTNADKCGQHLVTMTVFIHKTHHAKNGPQGLGEGWCNGPSPSRRISSLSTYMRASICALTHSYRLVRFSSLHLLLLRSLMSLAT